MLNLVVLTGAGISAESGLQTFRDSDGLWEGYKVEDVATPQAFNKNPQLVLEFYNQRRHAVKNAAPNKAHYGLKALEQHFNVQIITQNIDDLHERAGSRNVMHLHGEILKMRSLANENLIYPCSTDIHVGDVADDGSQLRPHIVWFGEAVPMIGHAAKMVAQADIFVIIGTSLLVYPAAGLVHETKYNTPICVLDKKIPAVRSGNPIHCIEKSACEGIEALTEHLMHNFA